MTNKQRVINICVFLYSKPADVASKAGLYLEQLSEHEYKYLI